MWHREGAQPGNATAQGENSKAGAGGIHSNAFNFMSAVSSGVDPRTGMYGCSISLPAVAANALCGPTVALGLSFNALNPVNAGFGIGWSLTMTRLDVARSRLSLSTGESFRLDAFVAGKATYKDRKLRSFDLFETTPGEYVIHHKSGTSERLRVIDGSNGVATLYEVRSPEGYVVTLKHSAANGIVTLDKVIDGKGRVLVSVHYDIATVVTLQPGTVYASDFTFRLGNQRLERLDLPQGHGDGWVFGYQATATGLLLLKSSIVPTGGREEVDYKLEGHGLPGVARVRPEVGRAGRLWERISRWWSGDALPDAPGPPLSHMPYVVECRRDPGHGQPPMRTRYTYSDQNYFGYGKLDDWLDNEDNLYRVVMPQGQRYEYSSTETHYDGLTPARTVERTFNRFHLLTRERSSQEGCVKDVVTVYGDDPQGSFQEQPAWCQLPVEVMTTYSRDAEPGRVRVDVGTYTYDTDGNRLSYRDANGALEELVYYRIGGEEGCPPDPLGFRRCVKQRTVRPPPGTVGATKVSRYRFEAMRSLVLGAPEHLLSVYEAIHHEVDGRVVATPLSETTQRYVVDRGPDHGRLAQVDVLVGGVHTITDYAYAIAEPVLVVTETFTGHTGADDALSVSTRSALSLHSGANVMDESPDGVVTRYAHDALGRLVRQSTAEGTPFAAVTTAEHELSQQGSWQMGCSVTGLRTRHELDGFGRAIRRVAVDWLGDGGEHEIWRARFDALGRLSSETTTDHAVPLATGVLGELSATTHYLYDAWGNTTQSVTAAGVAAHSLIDPIGRTEETWTEAVDSHERSDRSHTSYGKDGRPSRIERRDTQGNPTWWRELAYDGWGRCLSDVEGAPDIADKVTRYRYDDYDRVTETVLPDDSVVYRTYAGYTDESLVEMVGVRYVPEGKVEPVDIDLGRQGFDGLGRRVLFRSGTRDMTYLYQTPASAKPDQIRLPSGEILFCTYEKQLGHRPTEMTDQARTVACRFEYHPLLGQPILASNALGWQEADYLPSGQVKTERVCYGSDPVRQTGYTYSLLGLTASHDSVDGGRNDFRYDALGRVATVTNESLAVAFDYDAFSRTREVRTTSADGEMSMHVSLEYDEHAREVKRTLVACNGSATSTQTLVHAYTASNKLRSRRLIADDGERVESYGYDCRGRLLVYACTGIHAPNDPSGMSIAGQRFTFDALDNMLTMETTYADAKVPQRVSSFHHAADDPTQLVRIEHRQGDASETITLDYDANGNLRYDEFQRELSYDAMGRLVGWSQGGAGRGYRYDPLDRVGAIDEPASTRFRYYRDGKVAWENGAGSSVSFHVAGGACVGQSTHDATGRRTVLLGGDAQGSVVSEAGATLHSPAYGVYGYRADGDGASDIAYAGELKERDVGWYLLGSYRVYNPRFMRFHSPDASSPFGHGGLNAYAYVSGDPVNRVDPSGEGFLDWLPLVLAAVGTGIGVALSAGTLGPAAAALWTGAAVSFTQATAVVSTGAGLLSFATAAGSRALEKSGHASASRVLGWMSAGYGLGSAAVDAAPAAISLGRAVGSGIDKVRGVYRKLAMLPVRLRNAGGKPSKSADIGTRGIRPGRQNAAFVGDAAADAAPPLPPRAPRPLPDPHRHMTGMQRVNTAAALAARGMRPGQMVTPNMARIFPDGIGTRADDMANLLDARGRVSDSMGRLTQRDLTGSGFTDSEIHELFADVSLSNPSAQASANLSESAAHFRRFMDTDDMSALHASAEALRLARDGVSTHVVLPFSWQY
jgi:RHS repeat-associated protein